ncbi:tyrosine-type recombinase/integrase [Pseudoxanthomonas sp. UTMC 1351]|uniref:tyrosine-type recombinase/integrase n=1 Tax=Pseudoxanthomonas sp. UTMC 1351 TaxID=2695853 RepID=UPI0034D01ED6
MKFAKNNAAPTIPSQVLNGVQQAALQDIISPESDLNPFKKRHVRVRNQCLVQVMLETGVRRAELVLLELADVYLGASPTIRIRSSINAGARCRRDGASPKTRSRTVPITSKLARRLSGYLERERLEFTQRNRLSVHLFLSELDGQRLSVTAVNHVLRKLGSAGVFAKGGTRLHPHGIRSTSATEARRLMDAAGKASHSELEESLSYFGGWAPGSRMVRRYTREAVSEKVGRLLREERRNNDE